MDKRFLIEQLSDKLRESATVARKAGQAAADEARDGATAAEKRENARVAQEYAGLARGQAARASRAQAEISTLESFRPGPLPRGARIALGAIVEVEDEGMGRTFFLAPVGAGVELTGPAATGSSPWSRPFRPSARRCWAAGSARPSRSPSRASPASGPSPTRRSAEVERPPGWWPGAQFLVRVMVPDRSAPSSPSQRGGMGHRRALHAVVGLISRSRRSGYRSGDLRPSWCTSPSRCSSDWRSSPCRRSSRSPCS